MSFAHPMRLWLLAGVVVLVVAYVVAHLHRRRAIARYTNPSLHGRIAPDRQGWPRHVPPALSAVALALVLVGIAQPTRPERVAKDEGVVVLAVDVSASMTATDVTPTRIDAAIAGAEDFVQDVPDGIHLGLVAFDRNARLLVVPTTDHDSVSNAVRALAPGPGTAAGEAVFASLDAIEAALDPEVLASAGEVDVPAAIVLLSDGATTIGRSVDQAASAAGDAGIPVTTIAFGTPTGSVTVEGQTVPVPVPADTEAMASLADATGGTYFAATSAGELQDVYADIRTDVGYTNEPREVTRGVLGVALVVLAAALAAAVLLAFRPAISPVTRQETR